jgi:hypothetical protein
MGFDILDHFGSPLFDTIWILDIVYEKQGKRPLKKQGYRAVNLDIAWKIVW